MPTIRTLAHEIFTEASETLGEINFHNVHELLKTNFEMTGEMAPQKQAVTAEKIDRLVKQIARLQIPKNESEKLALHAAIIAVLPYVLSSSIKPTGMKLLLSNLYNAAGGPGNCPPEIREALLPLKRQAAMITEHSADQKRELTLEMATALHRTWAAYLMMMIRESLLYDINSAFDPANLEFKDVIYGVKEKRGHNEEEEEEEREMPETADIRKFFENLIHLNIPGAQNGVHVMHMALVKRPNLGQLSVVDFTKGPSALIEHISINLPMRQLDPRHLGDRHPQQEALFELFQLQIANQPQEIQRRIKQKLRLDIIGRNSTAIIGCLQISNKVITFKERPEASERERQLSQTIVERGPWKVQSTELSFLQENHPRKMIDVHWDLKVSVSSLAIDPEGNIDPKSTPRYHPLAMALRTPELLCLTPEQAGRLREWRDEMLIIEQQETAAKTRLQHDLGLHVPEWINSDLEHKKHAMLNDA